MTFGLVCKASPATSWAVEKSLACQKSCRWYCEKTIRVDIVCPICPIVRPSWGHLVPSCFLWGVFPVIIDVIWHFLPHEDIMKETRMLPTVVSPSPLPAMASRWDHDVGGVENLRLLGCTHGDNIQELPDLLTSVSPTFSYRALCVVLCVVNDHFS